MLKHKTWRVFLWLLAFIAGGFMFAGGVTLESWRSEQIDFYNAGITAHQGGDSQVAVEMFDRSLNAYQRALQAGWLERFVYPRANTELACSCQFSQRHGFDSGATGRAGCGCIAYIRSGSTLAQGAATMPKMRRSLQRTGADREIQPGAAFFQSAPRPGS